MNDINSTKCKIGKVRFSYLHVFTPRATDDGSDPKYSVTLIIPKSNEALLEQIKAAITNAFNGGIGKFGGKLPPKGAWKNPLRDGDLERPDDEAFAGSFFVNASSKTRPGVVKWGPAGKLVDITDENDLYSGCFGYASVNFFAFNSSGNKGVACGLNNILKTDNGDYLGGRTSAQSDFGDMAPEPANEQPSDDIF
jgi:Protein of unknown function (DUF2815).